jgi:predicted DCC family thiol-disulfide oxidoreductase YuxK
LALAARHHFSKSDLDQTFLVLSGDAALSRSDAGVEILSQLRAPWRWLAVVRIIPRPVRDTVYRFVARRRYRWFGRRENCVVVPASESHRFIGVRRAARRIGSVKLIRYLVASSSKPSPAKRSSMKL